MSNIKRKSLPPHILRQVAAHSVYNLGTINMANDPAFLEFFGLECWPDGCRFYADGLTLAEVLAWFDGEQILNAWLAPELGDNDTQDAPYAHIQIFTRSKNRTTIRDGVWQQKASRPLGALAYVHKQGTENNLSKADTNMGAMLTGEIIVKTWHAPDAPTCDEIAPFVPVGHVRENSMLLVKLGALNTRDAVRRQFHPDDSTALKEEKAKQIGITLRHYNRLGKEIREAEPSYSLDKFQKMRACLKMSENAEYRNNAETISHSRKFQKSSDYGLGHSIVKSIPPTRISLEYHRKSHALMLSGNLELNGERNKDRNYWRRSIH